MGDYSNICELRGRAKLGKGCTLLTTVGYCALKGTGVAATTKADDCTAVDVDILNFNEALPTPTPSPTPTPTPTPSSATIIVSLGNSLVVAVSGADRGGLDLVSYGPDIWVFGLDNATYSHALPIPNYNGSQGLDSVSPIETLASAVHTRTGNPVFIIGCATNGIKAEGIAGDLTNIAARVNAGIAAALAMPGISSVDIRFVGEVGSNPSEGVDTAASIAAFNAAIDTIHSVLPTTVYSNGNPSTGTPLGANFNITWFSMMPAHMQTDWPLNNAYDIKVRSLQGLAKYWPLDRARITSGEPTPLHPDAASNRLIGPDIDTFWQDTTVPTITTPNPTNISGQPFKQELVMGTGNSRPYITGGADAALFEIVWERDGDGYKWYYQRIGGATFDYSSPVDAGGNNVYDIQFTPRGGNGVTGAPISRTVTVTPPAVAPLSWTLVAEGQAPSLFEYTEFTVNLKAGVNYFFLNKPSGNTMNSATASATVGGVAATIIGVKDTSPSLLAIRYVSAVDVDNVLVHADLPGSNVWTMAWQHHVATGTNPVHVSVDHVPWSVPGDPMSKGPYTCPTDGMVVAAGWVQGSDALAAGTAGVVIDDDVVGNASTLGTHRSFAAHRLSTGNMSIANNASGKAMIVLVLEKQT